MKDWSGILRPLRPAFLSGALVSFTWLCPRGEATPCFPATARLTVDSVATAKALAETVNCTAGFFEVEWYGNIQPPETIRIPNSTFVAIGPGGNGSSPAVIDGADAHQLFTVDSGSLSIDGLTLMGGRSATHGGAIYSEFSQLELSNCTLRGNRAESGDGGAVYMHRSALEVLGDTFFEGNVAYSSGGAVRAVNSNTTFAGNVTFADNQGGRDSNEFVSVGGAAAFVLSTLMVTGKASFVNNSAYAGGAISLRADDAILNVTGEVVFHANEADMGGALLSRDAPVDLGGQVAFTENLATVGGAAYMLFNGALTLSGDIVFSNNSAEEDGGAMALAGGGSLTIGPEAVADFIGNTAGGNGGAIAAWGTATISSRETGVLSLQDNTAGDSGGGIHALSCDQLILDRPTNRNHVFVQNSALNNGGGIYAIDVSSFNLRGCDFIRNTARIGAGAAVYASFGESSSSLVGEVSRAPAEIGLCTFMENIATEVGGGLVFAYGSTAISDSVFEGNVAANSGGALFSVAEMDALANCTFRINEALSGAAVTNNGDMSSVEGLVFESNVRTCIENEYVAFTYPSEDSTSWSDVASERYDADCTRCTPWSECSDCLIRGDIRAPSCAVTPEHTASPLDNGTVESLLLDPGYWRASNTSTSILKCYVEDACAGGAIFGAYCSAGYQGPYCAVCQGGYYSSSGYTCSMCSSTSGIVSAALSGIVASLCVILAVAVLLNLVREGDRWSASGDCSVARGCARVKSAVRFHPLKILVVTWQIIGQISDVAGISYPSIYERFLAIVSLSNLDVASMLTVGCFISSGFYARLFVSTVGPLAILAVLQLTHAVALWRNRAEPDAVKLIWRKHVTVALVVAFLVYSHVSSIVFSMFACDDLDDGRSYVRADYTVYCDTTQHRLLQVYAAFMIMVYPVGIPFALGLLLLRHRRALLGKTGDREQDPRLRPFVDLWWPYRPEMYLYEMVWYLRRIVLTGVVVFIYPNTAAQIAVTMMLEFVFLVLSVLLLPYRDSFDTWLSHVSHGGVFLSLYLALLLKVDVSGEGTYNEQAFSVVLVLGHCLVLSSVIVKGLLVAWHIRKEMKVAITVEPSLSQSSLVPA